MTGPREPDAPLTDRERAELARIMRPPLRLIDAATAPDKVPAVRHWCERHGADLTFSDGRHIVSRGGEVLATGLDVGVLLYELERLPGGDL